MSCIFKGCVVYVCDSAWQLLSGIVCLFMLDSFTVSRVFVSQATEILIWYLDTAPAFWAFLDSHDDHISFSFSYGPYCK